MVKGSNKIFGCIDRKAKRGHSWKEKQKRRKESKKKGKIIYKRIIIIIYYHFKGDQRLIKQWPVKGWQHHCHRYKAKCVWPLNFYLSRLSLYNKSLLHFDTWHFTFELLSMVNMGQLNFNHSLSFIWYLHTHLNINHCRSPFI